MQAQRLEHIQEYYFSTKLKEIARLRAEGKPIINLGIGSPDLPPPEAVRQTLAATALQPDTHQYQSYSGISELRQAIAGYYQRYFGTGLDAETEILPLIGSKEGIMHISMAFLNQGDEVLLPDPGYMTYRSATLLAGGKPVYYTLNEANDYLPDLKALAQTDLKKVKLMWLNYPHMPTGAVANKDFYRQLIDFAHKHQILLVNDNPYSMILNSQPLSLLSISGAKAVALELNSLSKSHNMAGWRIGMLLGKKDYIDTVMKFKSQMDSGMFLGLQKAAVTALNTSPEWFEKLNEIYSRRKEMVLNICKALRLKARPNQSGLFVWAKLPDGQNSRDFTDRLLKEKDIFLAPGFIFGQHSDDYVRISLTNSGAILTETLIRITEK